MKLLGNNQRGKIFVISAPAGTGKTTLVHLLHKEFPCVVESISFTTRKPRLSEKEGEHYFFISEQEFLEKKRRGDFLEDVKIFDAYYGTDKATVERELNKGHHVVLVIDTQGAMILKKKTPAVFIFISPPSLEELERRLHQRKSESEETLKKRLSLAVHEMEMVKEYDYHIVNLDLKVAYNVLKSIVIAEEHSQKEGTWPKKT